MRPNRRHRLPGLALVNTGEDQAGRGSDHDKSNSCEQAFADDRDTPSSLSETTLQRVSSETGDDEQMTLMSSRGLRYDRTRGMMPTGRKSDIGSRLTPSRLCGAFRLLDRLIGRVASSSCWSCPAGPVASIIRRGHMNSPHLSTSPDWTSDTLDSLPGRMAPLLCRTRTRQAPPRAR